MVFCGDFETLKFLFNHPDMQDRRSMNVEHFMVQRKEERMLDQDKEMQGVS